MEHVLSCPYQADYQMGGGWGDRIEWCAEPGLAWGRRLHVYGWKTPRPEVGQTLVAEMKRSWLLARFVEVEHCADPPDMFFAYVIPIEQTVKETGEVRRAER